MPPIFIHVKGDTDFIVDGQQRLNTIWKFKDARVELGDQYSADNQCPKLLRRNL